MKELSLCEFASQLASRAAVPGGGGAAAVTGALGAALGAMAANLTIGKPKYAEVEEAMRTYAQQLSGVSQELLALADADAEAFEPLSAAYRLPKSPEKDAKLEQLLTAAAAPPQRMIELCLQALSILQALVKQVPRLVMSDIGCGAQMLRAALNAAALNVYINADMLKNGDASEAMFEKAWTMAKEGQAQADAVYAEVEAVLCR